MFGICPDDHTSYNHCKAYLNVCSRLILAKYPNRVLLIHGNHVEGDFDSEEAAITEGVRKFGIGPFLVRRAGEEEPVLSAPALTLSL